VDVDIDRNNQQPYMVLGEEGTTVAIAAPFLYRASGPRAIHK